MTPALEFAVKSAHQPYYHADLVSRGAALR